MVNVQMIADIRNCCRQKETVRATLFKVSRLIISPCIYGDFVYNFYHYTLLKRLCYGDIFKCYGDISKCYGDIFDLFFDQNGQEMVKSYYHSNTFLTVYIGVCIRPVTYVITFVQQLHISY